MPPHIPVGSLWLSMQVGLFVPAGSGLQFPVLSQVPQWLQSVLQQTPTVAFSGIAQLPLRHWVSRLQAWPSTNCDGQLEVDPPSAPASAETTSQYRRIAQSGSV